MLALKSSPPSTSFPHSQGTVRDSTHCMRTYCVVVVNGQPGPRSGLPLSLLLLFASVFGVAKIRPLVRHNDLLDVM